MTRRRESAKSGGQKEDNKTTGGGGGGRLADRQCSVISTVSGVIVPKPQEDKKDDTRNEPQKIKR